MPASVPVVWWLQQAKRTWLRCSVKGSAAWAELHDGAFKPARAVQVKLISLLTSCGLKVDDSSLGEIFETHLTQAAQARYRSLKAAVGKPGGALLLPHHVPARAACVHTFACVVCLLGYDTVVSICGPA